MGQAPMFGHRRPQEEILPYTPFFTPPYNEAKVIAIAQPVGHLESEVLGLRGYSIESVDGVPDLIETSYCPLNWEEIQPDVPTSSIRTGFPFHDLTEAELQHRGRRQLVSHAWSHIVNSHPSWRAMLAHSGFERESAELREALDDRPRFTTNIELDGRVQQAVAIEHLGERFVQLILRDDGVILTIAGHPAIFENRFTLRLPIAV